MFRKFTNSPIGALFGVLTLILVLGFGLYAYHSWQGLKREAVAELDFISQLLGHTTNEVFNHHRSVLRILGERLLEVDAKRIPARGKVLVDQLLRLNPGIAGFGLARADGQLVLVSGIDAGEELPNLLQQPESARSFRQVLAQRGMVTGRTYFLPLLRRWVIPLRIAIEDGQGNVPLVMTLGIDVDAKAATWNALELPPAVEVRILRPQGHWQFIKPLAESSKAMSYARPVDPKLLRIIAANSRTHAPSTPEAKVFTFGHKLQLGAYLPDWDLYTVVSLPVPELLRDYGLRMAAPGALFGSFLLVGLGFFRISLRQQRQYEARLISQAQHDNLTGLPNRLLVMDRLGHALDLARRGHRRVAVAFIDLDRFKRINDSFGHLVGDELLCECARRFKGLLREGDTVARLGGDEFLLVLPDVGGVDSVEAVMHKIQGVFRQPFAIGQREAFSTCSIGLALFPEDGTDPDSLLQAADTALYKAKDGGRNRYCFYSEQMNREAERRMEIEFALRHALENGELGLVYQPQVDLKTGGWAGCEALLRWNNARLGSISPAEFIPIAEESGLIHSIGDFVLETACRDLARLKPMAPKGFKIAINLSTIQLHQHGLPATVETILRRHGLAAAEVELEITESMMLDNPRQLEALHQLGLSIAVDDFGTGFCSLGYLRRFPVNCLKIDRSFVKNIEQDRDDAKLVRAIITLAYSLGLRIVAEGIETEGQLHHLERAGCELGQGYYFSRGIGVQQLMDTLATAP